MSAGVEDLNVSGLFLDTAERLFSVSIIETPEYELSLFQLFRSFALRFSSEP